MLSSLSPLLAHSDSNVAGLGGLIFGGTFLLFMLAFFIIGVGLFIFWIVMLIDALRRTNWPNNDQRTLWLIILIASFFLQVFWVAALIYYFAMKKPLDDGKVPTFFENQKPTPPAEEAKSTHKKTSHKK